MSTDTQRGLSARELNQLEELKIEMCGLCVHAIDLMERLTARCESVPDRLACVLHDCLMPALHDLGSIAEEAREHVQPTKPRRSHAHRATARRARRGRPDAGGAPGIDPEQPSEP